MARKLSPLKERKICSEEMQGVSLNQKLKGNETPSSELAKSAPHCFP
jgi:hypothetical protein